MVVRVTNATPRMLSDRHAVSSSILHYRSKKLEEETEYTDYQEPAEIPEDEEEKKVPERWLRAKTEEDLWEIVAEIVREYEKLVVQYVAAMQEFVESVERDPVLRDLLSRRTSRRLLAVEEGARASSSNSTRRRRSRRFWKSRRIF